MTFLVQSVKINDEQCDLECQLPKVPPLSSQAKSNEGANSMLLNRASLFLCRSQRKEEGKSVSSVNDDLANIPTLVSPDSQNTFAGGQHENSSESKFHAKNSEVHSYPPRYQRSARKRISVPPFFTLDVDGKIKDDEISEITVEDVFLREMSYVFQYRCLDRSQEVYPEVDDKGEYQEVHDQGESSESILEGVNKPASNPINMKQDSGMPQTPAQNYDTTKPVSAQDLKSRIHAERHRIQSKRDKLRLQRVREVSIAEVSIHDLEGEIIAPNKIISLDTVQWIQSDPLLTLPNDEIEIEQHRDKRFHSRQEEFMLQDPSGPYEPKILTDNPELHEALDCPERFQHQKRCSSQHDTIKYLCFLITAISVTAALTLICFLVTNYIKGDSNSLSDPSKSCQDLTNIFPGCLCQDNLDDSIFSKEMFRNREQVLKYMVGIGVINTTTAVVTTPTSCKAHNQALLWVADTRNYIEGTQPSTLEVFQRYILLMLFQRLGGNSWKRRQNWLNSKASICEWEGIVCTSSTLEIREINLNSNALRGMLPTHELHYLTALRQIHLSSNQYLLGTLSSELMTLPLLHSFMISNTSISGNIPNEMGTQIAELYMSSTQLTGTIPSQLGLLNRTRILDLSQNKLTGTIPSEIQRLRLLESLDLSSNDLSGTLQSTWKTPVLDTLNVHDNIHLRGNYPKPPSSLLTVVDFAGTSLMGKVSYAAYCDLQYLESIFVDCDNGVAPSSCSCCTCK